MTLSNPATYRPEIDGMRAIAILAVVGFHLGFSSWKGGFVGVDVFFVLSGYLICGQTYASLRQGSFSIRNFLAGRIRRLSFASFLCFFTVGCAAWAVLLPFEMPLFHTSFIGSITFTQNFVLMGQSGYFAPAMSANPLLHTWSLAIEEQFYILLPSLILLTNRKPRAFVACLLLMFLLSLALTLGSGDQVHSREARYFATDFRIWELSLGGLIAVLMQHRTIPRLPLAAPLGFAAATAPVFLLDGAQTYPGPWSLVVAGGTALMLAYARPATTWTGKLLATRVPRNLGRVSYGTYLWHWPLISFYDYFGQTIANDNVRMAFLLAALVLGSLSYFLIEAPARRIDVRRHRNKLFAAFGVQTVVLLCLAQGLSMRNQTIDPQVSARLIEIQNAGANANPRWAECWFRPSAAPPCPFGGKQTDKATKARPILLWGDSMANSAVPAFDHLARERGVTGRAYVAPSCPPLLDIARESSTFEECIAANDAALTFLDSAPPSDVYLFARWAYYAGGFTTDLASPRNSAGFVDRNGDPVMQDSYVAFERSLSGLLEKIPARHRIHLIGPVPEMAFSVPQQMITAFRFGKTLPPVLRTQFETRTRPTILLLDRLAAARRASFLDLTDAYCTASQCAFERGGLPVFADQVHFAAIGADILHQTLTSMPD